jgi:hypothetical protein|tara:strand:+ start:589 stop:762 length:174 start_codon:yes stop_codon:yes gene_type:complete
MVYDLTEKQLESALFYLCSPYQKVLPKILESLTEQQWVAVELLAVQLQQERATVTIH